MECYKYLGHYRLEDESRHLQYLNLRSLHEAESSYRMAKMLLTEKVNQNKKSGTYIIFPRMFEYIFYLGCKENLRILNAERKYIKSFIKSMNRR